MVKAVIVVMGVFIGAMLGVIGSWLFAVAYGLGVLTAAVMLQTYVTWGQKFRGTKRLMTVVKYSREALETGTYYVVLGKNSTRQLNAVVLLNEDSKHLFVLELPDHVKFQEQLYAVEYEDGYKVRRVALKKEVRSDATKKWGDGA